MSRSVKYGETWRPFLREEEVLELEDLDEMADATRLAYDLVMKRRESIMNRARTRLRWRKKSDAAG